MSLADLHNPKAAADLIASFRKRFSTKVCMAPMSNHEMPIVSAHTLSVESMLRKIALDGHVYTFSQARNFTNDCSPIEVRRKGIRDVSVFNGFCSKHDRELFACLETDSFKFTRQQLFMLAYRATARECYLKRKQAESLITAETYANIHGITEPVKLSDEALLFHAASLSGAKDVEALKTSLDAFLIGQEWDRLVSYAILFSSTPTVLATTAFQPFFDMDGTQLQDFEDLQAEMSQIMMSLIPIDTGGAAIFSWLDTANNAPRRFFESVLRGRNLTSAVLHAVLDNTENVAYSPDWYEGLSQEQQQYILSRMLNFEFNGAYSSKARPDEAAPVLAHWGEAISVSF